MKVTLKRVYHLCAAHALPMVRDGHKCKVMHGHNYTIALEYTGEVRADGMVTDFADLDAVARPIIMKHDHQCWNDFIENPTSENIAIYLARELNIAGLTAIEVSETPRSAARLEL